MFPRKQLTEYYSKFQFNFFGTNSNNYNTHWVVFGVKRYSLDCNLQINKTLNKSTEKLTCNLNLNNKTVIINILVKQKKKKVRISQLNYSNNNEWIFKEPNAFKLKTNMFFLLHIWFDFMVLCSVIFTLPYIWLDLNRIMLFNNCWCRPLITDKSMFDVNDCFFGFIMMKTITVNQRCLWGRP
jgi:hypothetical protein